jgi:hypothetical protein
MGTAARHRFLENYEVEPRNDRSASHRLSVRQPKAGTGRIRTTVDQPYAAHGGVFDIEVRYFDGKNGRSELKLFVGGVEQGTPWTASGDTGSWKSKTFARVPVRPADEIMVQVRADGQEAGKLDYVQLNYRGEARGTTGSAKSRFTAAGPLAAKQRMIYGSFD